MRTFLVVLAEGAWPTVSTAHDERNEQNGDAPCLEDVGVGELELFGNRTTAGQRLGDFAVVCARWRER